MESAIYQAPQEAPYFAGAGEAGGAAVVASCAATAQHQQHALLRMEQNPLTPLAAASAAVQPSP